jgi:hypothetical protein
VIVKVFSFSICVIRIINGHSLYRKKKNRKLNDKYGLSGLISLLKHLIAEEVSLTDG